MSFLKELADLTDAKPVSHDPESFEDFGDGTVASTSAFKSYANDAFIGEASNMRQEGALNDLATRYKGKIISRKDLNVANTGDISSDESILDETLQHCDEDHASDDSVSSENDEDETTENDRNEAQAKLNTGTLNDDIEDRLATLRAEDASTLLGLASKGVDRVEKSEQMKNQRIFWEFFLEQRIRMQPLLNCANRFPRPVDHAISIKSGKHAMEIDTKFNDASKSISAYLVSLMKLQGRLLTRLPSTDQKESDADSSSDEDQLYQNVNDFVSNTNTTEMNNNTTNGMLHTRDLKENTNEIDVETEQKDEKLPTPEAMWKVLDKRWNKRILPYVGKVANHFSRKAYLDTGGVERGIHKKKLELKAFKRSITEQVDSVLVDKLRLVQRTQERRSKYRIIGEGEIESSIASKKNKKRKSHFSDIQDDNSNEGNKKDVALTDALVAEIFDDTDFYTDLLNEIIQGDGELSMKSDVRRPRKKYKSVKKNVDRKASKGRKVRYLTHPKLLNFMSAVDELPNSIDVTRLFQSLFGGLLQR